ncbi:MAG TPA: nitroreductase family deazaflavin-dependent oxidoreductase [Deltaproteobacteria bacterium]|jgi:deazaflavin-dependent oxidoreductase (nitroreductase family)|nr:nitroreductase family deazaflavin-dependent oxidoreductase [Deltaproteobacteria bacterium]
MAKWRNVTRIHRAVYRLSGGRLGARLAGIPMLLLSTVGRKSGLRRTVPLAYLADGDDFVVVASNGGQEVDPAWWRNLQQDPQAQVQVGAQTLQAKARLASPAERARLWPLLTQANPAWAAYEKNTKRPIPVVVLGRTA